MPTSEKPIRVYRHALSGHCHRVELMLSLLGVPFEALDTAFGPAGSRSPEGLARNAFGQLPVIEDGDLTLADSNAILVYLCRKHDPAGRWYPDDPATAGRIQRWLSVAARQLAEGPATARIGNLFNREIDVEKAHGIAHTLFGIVDAELSARPFLAGDAPTIADVAHYSYTAHAPEGGVSLKPYPNIRAWLARIEALPGFVGMPRSAVGLAA
ncbi:glutathione S-transferase [Thalassobaculum sp.]|uniref:glutathione S-transferase n=1 Tax=Thalassobaculum sp. TaxID=2022740 RepID=UPI0032ECB63D